MDAQVAAVTGDSPVSSPSSGDIWINMNAISPLREMPLLASFQAGGRD